MAAMILSIPVIPSRPSPLGAEISSELRRRSDYRSRAVNDGRCWSDLLAPDNVASCSNGVSVSAASASFWSLPASAGVLTSASGLVGWSASAFLRCDEKTLARSRKRVALKKFTLRIAAEKPDFTKVAGTLLRLGKQSLDAGTKFVPESVPRPAAQVGVGLAGVVIGSFVLRSLFSTVTFVLAIGALSYAGYSFLTKGDSSSSSRTDRDSRGSSGKPKSTEEALEEARKIMDKYK